MTDAPEAPAQDPLMALYGVNRHQQYGPSGIDLTDPSSIDWNALTRTYNLSPGEVQQLQVPSVPSGPNIQQRLESLRPGLNLGPLRLSTDGHKVTGRMRF
jgi:hypothetical protein